VTAGIYMVARAQPLYVETPTTLLIVTIVGVLTAFIGATIALVQTDIKRVVAYSTVSQLGFMCFALGVGAWIPAIFHLVTHAFFKGLLFLGSGSVIHGMHEEQDIRKMGGLRRYMPITAWTFLIASLANAGIVPFAGFWSKDEILYGALHAHYEWVYVIGLFVSFLTAFYMFRLYFLVFEGQPRFDQAHVHPHESGPTMALPLVILGVASLLAGVVLGYPLEQGFIHQFLKPVFAHGAEGYAAAINYTEIITYSAIAVGVALLGILLAWSMYMRGAPAPERIRERFRGVRRFLEAKWGFDAFNQAVFVASTREVASFLWQVVDVHIIDGLVNGTAAAVSGISGQLRKVQTGFVGNYALAIAFGMVLFVGIYLVSASLR
jgi:NADH-quinone oxidoreductase subunit L